MKNNRTTIKLTALLGITLVMLLSACQSKQPKGPSFTKDVFPLLQKRCSECHLPGGKGFEASGFSVADYKSVMKGTRLGPVIIAGQSVASTLVILVEGKADPSIRMPHGKEALPAAEIKIIKDWVNAGAMEN